MRVRRWAAAVLLLGSTACVRPIRLLTPAAPPPVPGFPVGWCIRVQGTALEDARWAGFEVIDLALQDVRDLPEEQFAAVLDRVRAAGVPPLAGYNFIPDDLPLLGPAADRAREDRLFQRGLPRLQRLGLEYVIFNSGPARRAPPGLAPAEARAQLVAFSRRFAEAAAPFGLTVLLEPLRRSDTNVVNTVAEAVEMVNAVGHPRFQMMVDFSFMTIEKEPPEAVLAAGPHLRHVHIANPNGRGYPMDLGEADYAGFFRALGRIGYRGAVNVHARTSAFTSDAPRALTLLRDQLATLAR